MTTTGDNSPRQAVERVRVDIVELRKNIHAAEAEQEAARMRHRISMLRDIDWDERADELEQER